MPTDFLIEHNIEIYMNDVLFLLLKYRKKNPNVIVNQFFADYFRTIKTGNHVLYRNFEYINSTSYNRKCFIKLWWDILQPLSKSNDLLSINEILSLTALLSPGFPIEPIKASYEFCSIDNVSDLTFEEFGCRFQFYLIYQEFIHQISSECHNLESSQNLLYDKESSKISFSTMDWLRIINKFPLKTDNILLPNLTEMKQLVSNHSSLSLQEFLFHMVNSDFIIEEIGIVKSTNFASKASNDNPDNAVEQVNESYSTKGLSSKNSKCLTESQINTNTKKSKSNINSFKPKSSLPNKKGNMVKVNSTNSLLNKPSTPEVGSRGSNKIKSSIQIEKYRATSLIENNHNDDDGKDTEGDEESDSSTSTSTDDSTEN